MDDEALLKTMKNGLMIAGHEMGPVGDHWPALNAVRAGLEKEFEDHERNLAVVGELEFHLAEFYRDLEEIAEDANEQDKAMIKNFLKTAWEEYYAVLEPVDAKVAPKGDDLEIEGGHNFPNMKAAVHILKSLGGRA